MSPKNPDQRYIFPCGSLFIVNGWAAKPNVHPRVEVRHSLAEPFLTDANIEDLSGFLPFNPPLSLDQMAVTV
jgi:hypothetical protein